MNLRPLVILCGGVALGIAFILACGHNPPAADAADQCICPPAEPPLSGRIVQVTQPITLLGGTTGKQGGIARCAAGATVLGGGCRGGASVTPLVDNGPALPADGAGAPAWECAWVNNDAPPVQVTAVVTCLNP